MRENFSGARSTERRRLETVKIGTHLPPPAIRRATLMCSCAVERQAGFSAGALARGIRTEDAKSFVFNGAEERTRTSTVLLPPAPQAGASANSATSAVVQTFHFTRKAPGRGNVAPAADVVAGPRHDRMRRLRDERTPRFDNAS